MKREDINIYLMAHKPIEYGLWDNDLYTPIECGAALRDEHICEVRDDQGEDNISKDNRFWCEVTAMHWIWKNVHTKYKGQCQYRRRLEFAEDYDFDKAFEDCDIIAAPPLICGVWYQYRTCHNVRDFEIMMDILNERYGDIDGFVRMPAKLYYSNGFIMRGEDYDRYCEWLFELEEEWKKRSGIDMDNLEDYVKGFPPEKREYQMRIGGYLSERLLSYYIYHNKLRVKTVDYNKYEGICI